MPDDDRWYRCDVSEYGSFCPVSKAAEVLCDRWSLLIVRELLCGSTRFTEFRRGLPACPPATLSKRLKRLERSEVIDRTESSTGIRYELTDAGRDLLPIVQGLGEWGQRWVRSSYTDDELDPDELLWDLRRFLEPGGLGQDPCVVLLELTLPRDQHKRYWFVVDAGVVDLCDVDPHREVDCVVVTHLRTLTRIWMGDDTYEQGVRNGLIATSGPRALVRRMPAWLGQHPVLASVPSAR